MLARTFRFVAGVLLLPLCCSLLWALFDLLYAIQPDSTTLFPPAALALGGGFLIWLALWFFLSPPMRTYVLAHELSHALWSIMFGGKASNLKVTAQGGSVQLTKVNLLVTLAPYFFPFYTIIVVLLRLIVGLFISPLPYPLLWLFMVGFTWSFHFTFTLQTLTVKQPDIQIYGRTLSYTIIWLLNLFGIAIWIIATSDATFDYFMRAWIDHTITICTLIASAAQSLTGKS